MNEYDILVSVNDNFVPPLKALLHSLFINNPDRKINIHLMYSELTRESIAKVKAVTQKYYGGFYSYKVKEEHANALPPTGRFTAASFFRLIAFKYIPDSVRKLLYLDADMIVNGSIADLYDTPMYVRNADGTVTKYLFAAVSSETTDEYKKSASIYKSKLEIPDSFKHVYSSLLVINLQLLREVITIDDIFELCEDLKDNLIYPDQDFLNIVFYKFIRYLDENKYNCIPLISDISHISLNNPVIIHYNGIKPWDPSYLQNTQILRESKILYDIYASLD